MTKEVYYDNFTGRNFPAGRPLSLYEFILGLHPYYEFKTEILS